MDDDEEEEEKEEKKKEEKENKEEEWGRPPVILVAAKKGGRDGGRSSRTAATRGKPLLVLNPLDMEKQVGLVLPPKHLGDVVKVKVILGPREFPSGLIWLSMRVLDGPQNS